MHGIARIISFLLILLALACGEKPSDPLPEPAPPPVVRKEPEILYGIPADSFTVKHGKVARNQNLSDILSGYGVNYQTIHELADRTKSIFNVRQLRPGKQFTAFLAPQDHLRYFVYETNYVEYVVFDIDSLRAWSGEKEVNTVERSVNGKIESSLYNAMEDGGLKPSLAMELSEVFAWQIDFFRVQKGDRFRVIFEERFIGKETAGYGRILGAAFSHNGKEFIAIRFSQDGKEDYFDEEGNSLRKAFLKAPLQFSRISSRFSKSRYHPVLKYYRPHLGVDYAAPRGTPIRSVGDGEVEEASFSSGNGNYVKVRHNSMYSTAYLHMSRRADGIKKGKRVTQGEVIGYVGSTGLATGPHLCFRFYKNGEQVNPLTIEAPPSEPVAKEYREAFEEAGKKMIARLEAIDN